MDIYINIFHQTNKNRVVFYAIILYRKLIIK